MQKGRCSGNTGKNDFWLKEIYTFVWLDVELGKMKQYKTDWQGASNEWIPS